MCDSREGEMKSMGDVRVTQGSWILQRSQKEDKSSVSMREWCGG